jgi:DNA-binding NarL/FixJ family response regulator
LVEQAPRLTLVSCVSDAAAVVSRALDLRPAICILEDALPFDAIAAVTEIGARLPTTRVLVTHDDPESSALDILAAGASGYVDRATASDELEHLLERVAGGEIVLTPGQINELVTALRDPSRPRRRVATEPRLTAREWQVLELLRHRHTMPEIADELFLSPATVRSHVRAIRRKLGASGPGTARAAS